MQQWFSCGTGRFLHSEGFARHQVGGRAAAPVPHAEKRLAGERRGRGPGISHHTCYASRFRGLVERAAPYGAAPWHVCLIRSHFYDFSDKQHHGQPGLDPVLA